MTLRATHCLLLIALALAGCASSPRGPYAPPAEASRDPHQAARLTAKALDIIDDDPRQAEKLLRQALAHDLFHAQAHNNLGVLYLKHNRLYEAASEFEWAKKLLPGHPDPRLNLGITLERAGRIDDAIAGYRAALEVYPDHIGGLQALARAQLRHDRADDATPHALNEIALRGESERWRAWAREMLATHP